MSARGVVRIAAIALTALAAFSVGRADAAPGDRSASAAQPGTTRMMLGYRPGTAAAVKAAVAAAGGRIVADLDDFDGLVVDLSAAAVRRLQLRADVDFVENDPPRYARPSAMRRPAAIRPLDAPPSTQVVPYGIPMVQADQVSDSMGAMRKVCIVDSGIDRSHEDLQGIVMDGANFSGSGDWFTDEARHGTHVAGTIAAVSNDRGVVGVLPHANIRLFIAKVLDENGEGTSSTIVQGLRACMQARANVVNMSLGGPGSSRMEQRVVTRLAARNILLVAAAGNDGTNAVEFPAGFAEVISVAAVDSNKQVASFSQFNADVELAGPGVDVLSTVPMGTGREPSVTVGGTPYASLATDGPPGAGAGALADFGFGDVTLPDMTGRVCLVSRGNGVSFGDKVLHCEQSGGVAAIIYNNEAGEVAATLGGAAVTIPSVTVTQADGQAMLRQLGQTASVTVAATNYESFQGTSMASPHVAGVAALVWSWHSSCTAAQIRTTLGKSALDLGTPGRDDHYGFGLVQAKAAYDRIATMSCNN